MGLRGILMRQRPIVGVGSMWSAFSLRLVNVPAMLEIRKVRAYSPALTGERNLASRSFLRPNGARFCDLHLSRAQAPGLLPCAPSGPFRNLLGLALTSLQKRIKSVIRAPKARRIIAWGLAPKHHGERTILALKGRRKSNLSEAVPSHFDFGNRPADFEL